MRLAVSGTHGSGKTTLVEDFVAAHPSYEFEPEPYEALSALGVAFRGRPDADDLLQQMEHSIETLNARSSDANVVFDRCPLDFVAYLQALGGGAADDAGIGAFLEAIEEAVHTLDLIVFLPLSSPDEMAGEVEYPALRRRVDRRLKSILRDDSLSLFGGGRPRRLELRGLPSVRLAALAAALGLSAAPSGAGGPRRPSAPRP